jgi:phospholipid/cholesterol/gamma-HCH transport system ATP-binding protein
LRPESGSIRVDGTEVIGLKGRALAAHQARFGMLFQGGALFDSLPVWRNVSFALSGTAESRRAAAIDNLARVGLGADVADLRPSELSGGMQKRVALARAVLLQPKVVLADEPTASLDDAAAADAVGLLLATAKTHGATLVIATHDARVAALIPHGVDGQIGFQTLNLLGQQL